MSTSTPNEPGSWPHPAPVDDGGTSHLVAGTRLPSLNLQSTMGGHVDLSTLQGTNVINVYPWTGRPGLSDPPGWDDIPGAHGSTPQLAGLRDKAGAFEAAGVGIYALSGQDTDFQKELADRLALPFPVLSDVDGHFRGALKLPTFVAGGTRYLHRLALIIVDGAVNDVIYPIHPPPAAAEVILSRLGRSAS